MYGLTLAQRGVVVSYATSGEPTSPLLASQRRRPIVVLGTTSEEEGDDWPDTPSARRAVLADDARE